MKGDGECPPSKKLPKNGCITTREDSMDERVVIVFIGIALAAAAQSGLPDWLGGKPDVVVKPDRCKLYDWFFNEADSQMEGKASQDDLARKRVINLANKLSDYHHTANLPQYSGEVRYLVFGGKQPFHFSFEISGEELDGLLQAECDE